MGNFSISANRKPVVIYEKQEEVQISAQAAASMQNDEN